MALVCQITYIWSCLTLQEQDAKLHVRNHAIITLKCGKKYLCVWCAHQSWEFPPCWDPRRTPSLWVHTVAFGIPPPTAESSTLFLLSTPWHLFFLLLGCQSKLQLMTLNRSYLIISHIRLSQIRIISRHRRLVCADQTCSLWGRSSVTITLLVTVNSCSIMPRDVQYGMSEQVTTQRCRVSLCSPVCVITPFQTWWQGFNFVAVASVLRGVPGEDDQWEWSDSCGPCQTLS